MTQIVLRVEANAHIGFGHLVRSVALGRALASQSGMQYHLLMREPPLHPPCPVTPLPDSENAGAFLRAMRPMPDIVVADLYQPCARQLQALRDGPWLLACVDDDGVQEFDCDVLVNPNLDTKFTHRRAERVLYLAGGKYILLRAQFSNLPPHPVRPHVRHLLVCMGGGDPHGMAQIWTALREGASGLERVTAVVGDPALAEKLQATLPASGRWQVKSGVADIAGLMREADAGVLAGGTLLYEAAAAGLPALLASVNATQGQEVAAACACGFGISLGVAQNTTASALAAGLKALSAPAVRAVHSQQGQAMVDGCGAGRVAGHILARKQTQ